MKWPEHCSACYPRVPDARPGFFNPRTGKAFCRACTEMPGFWRTMFDKTDPIIKHPEPLDVEVKDAK